MEARPLKYLVEAVGGQLGHGDENTFFHGVSTDSRRVAPGDLFVALRGDRFDGHDYITEVEQRGAITVLVDRPVETKCAVVEVGNTRIALGKFATSYRRDYELPVIGIGGSNGKTTTKELLAAILRRHFAAIWSEASFNNSIGVPLTLLRIENFHRAAVLELGTNHPGELAPLVEMAAPRYGVITSIGREHLEFFTDVEGVALEEGVIGELLPTSGKLFLYDDSQWSNQIAARSAAPTCMVGMNAGNDWQADDVRVLRDGVTFNVNGPLPGEYRLRLLGRHQVGNALLAVAVAAELGVPAETIREGLAACRSPQRRLQVREVGGVCIIDDAYNANADSVVAALQVLADMPCEGRRIVVVGHMAELGDATNAAHEEAALTAAALGLDVIFAIGPEAEMVVSEARNAGISFAEAFDDNATAGRALRELVKAGDAVLLKASRVARLEEVGAYLILS